VQVSRALVEICSEIEQVRIRLVRRIPRAFVGLGRWSCVGSTCTRRTALGERSPEKATNKLWKDVPHKDKRRHVEKTSLQHDQKSEVEPRAMNFFNCEAAHTDRERNRQHLCETQRLVSSAHAWRYTKLLEASLSSEQPLHILPEPKPRKDFHDLLWSPICKILLALTLTTVLSVGPQ
jgi:hypothetical protein